MQVVPVPPSTNKVHVAPLAQPVSTRQRLQVVLGLVYIVVSLACGAWYVMLLFPNVSNDHYLAHYNVSDFEVFLIDIVNVKLQQHAQDTATSSDSMDLLSSDAVLPKSYAGLVVQPSFESTYARRVLYSELNTLPWAIENIRNTSHAMTRSIYANYCWVDFDRRWDITHTMARSKRCHARYTDDAAKYLETLFRNIDWTAFLALNSGAWTIAIGNALLESDAGVQWLADRPHDAMRLPIPDEVAFLHSINLTRYVLQYQNAYYNGLAESITLKNTLGLRETIPVKAVSEAWGPWTTVILSWNFRNDLYILSSYNASLVRNSEYYFANNQCGLTYGLDISAMYGFLNASGEYETQTNIFYTLVGPFGSVDTTYVPLPRSFASFYALFMTMLFDFVWSTPTALTSFQTIANVEFNPLPPNFVGPNLMYYGGNILCLYNPSTSFPQAQYNFDDTCSATAPFQITATNKAILFALFATGASNIDAICTFQTNSDATACQTLTQSHSFLTLLTDNVPLSTLSELLPSVMRELPAAEFVQYAQNATTNDWLLLRQPLLISNPIWAFYGWVSLFDWVEGKREVIQLEGDIDAIILMSDVTLPLHLVDNSNRSDSHGLQGNELLFYAVAYTSVVASLVGVTIVCYSMRANLNVAWRHLIMFNRVACSVWIGRPLLLLRGLTAMLLLSTAQTMLVMDHSLSKFEFQPRSVVETMVLASESTWLSYVASDILLVVTGGPVARHAAPVASTLAWLTTLLLSWQSPVRLAAAVCRQCSVVDMEFTLICQSGVVQTGSWHRMVVLVSLQTGSVVVCSAVAGFILGRRRRLVTIHAPMLLHGAAAAFFDSSTIDHIGILLDDASCVMTGLLPVPWQPTIAFDVKLWIVVQNDSHFIHIKAPTFVKRATTAIEPTRELTWTWRSTAAVGVGLAYVCLTATGSISYIAVSSVNFANDFNWATFNLTGHHVAMANWFNEQLVLGRTLPEFRFDEPRCSRHPGWHPGFRWNRH
ncbi:Aste57867_1289 [Aphanomyces stellatus]|uniref:Aste57867_1289 protein n=1 Tax=Aphanomyces stellatus TaxID=120398 RepID=A0A485K589_9STRA|nr:hypothetical protein As57867_001288 [Aphanomyces stellatus]VFT78508.1 Aste57867_1289 [Aphanomyces stellatus]